MSFSFGLHICAINNEKENSFFYGKKIVLLADCTFSLTYWPWECTQSKMSAPQKNKQTNKHKTPTFKVSDLYVHYYFIIAVSDLFQPISLGMHRSDYMLNCSVPTNEIIASRQKVDLEGIQLRQIEFNTMASSFGGLAQKVEECHRYINQYRIIIIWGACLISPLCLNNMSGESDSSTCYL